MTQKTSSLGNQVPPVVDGNLEQQSELGSPAGEKPAPSANEAPGDQFEANRPRRHESPRRKGPATAAGIELTPGTDVEAGFDPGRQLQRLGIRPIRTTPAGLDVRGLLRRDERGGTVTFSYPNQTDPSRPTVVHLVPHSQLEVPTGRERYTVADPRVQAWLETPEAGTANNFENTDMAAMRRLVETYVAQRPGVLRQLGITDPSALTPAQAANLAGYITVEQLQYNTPSIALEGTALFHPSLRAAEERLRGIDPQLGERLATQRPRDVPGFVRDMDELGVEQMLTNSPDAVDGVCRNYTEVFQALWQTLKGMQDTERSQLNNTYLKFPMGDFHIWNALYTVQPDGSIIGTQIDPTWADSAGVRPNNIRTALDQGSRRREPFATSRSRFAAQDLHLEVNGTTKAQILTDYYTVWLVSHDLAAQGRAADGARLFDRYLRTLPDVTRQDLIYWTEGGLIRPSLSPAEGWERPGMRELARELGPLIEQLESGPTS